MRKRRFYIPILVLICAFGLDVQAQECAFGGNMFGNTNAAAYELYSYMYEENVSVYAPFSDYLPSDGAAEMAGLHTPSRITNRRNGFITPGDVNQDPESPIGEPWVMLVFAGVAGVMIVAKQKRCKTL